MDWEVILLLQGSTTIMGVFQCPERNQLTFSLTTTEAADAAAEAAGVHAMRAALDANLTLEQVADEAWNMEFWLGGVRGCCDVWWCSETSYDVMICVMI